MKRGEMLRTSLPLRLSTPLCAPHPLPPLPKERGFFFIAVGQRLRR